MLRLALWNGRDPILKERLFGLTNSEGNHGDSEKFQSDPHWRDLVLFYEYFHGDGGRGIGASHQTGWTGCIARMIQANPLLTREALLSPGVEQVVLRAAMNQNRAR